ncbi:heterokaryon incompatibility protein-domain-containing protein [Dactylonectria macrodidyma]|uniref:Heterokaryon incompatibility protein-domain-containing protein n=1 Tax=Dactylonectria macrodidyma TaxID=307937 RepID=A0A9P9FS85_9HYPO|nr:heterokaryon incompatibility protein-domain-containing protein [Dactylonectria macrodidyma]
MPAIPKMQQSHTCLYDLWIDAICVNQSDTEERTAQVALMSHIYSNAKSVVVWLGREDMTTQGASAALRGRSISRHQMFDIRGLINRSWFTRKWVIQEFCLAEAIEMWCGAFQINCDRLLDYDLEHLLPALGASGSSPATILQQGRKGLGIWDVLTLRRWFQQIRSPPLDCSSHLSPPSLPALIALTWHFKSADPRDNIFALLGIVSKYPVEGTPCDLVADYSTSTEEVFLQAGRVFIEAKGRNEVPTWNKNPEILEPLEGLSFVQHHEFPDPATENIIPSWVPHFHRELTTARLWDRRFSAASGEKLKRCTAIWPSDPRLLKLNGYLVDQVTEASSDEGAQKGQINVSVPQMAAWFRMTLGLEVRYQELYDVSRVEVVWRTLMADDIWHTQPSIARETFKEFVCEHIRMCGEQARQLLSRLRADDDSESLPSLEEIDNFKTVSQQEVANENPIYRVAERAFHASFKRFSFNRHLFRTERGYLGLGPRSARAGDQIWLIAGARTPFVLRPARDDAQGRLCFQLIGECYVHGMMHGEAVGESEMSFKPIEIK